MGTKLLMPWRDWWRDLRLPGGLGFENGFLVSIFAYSMSMASIYTTATYLPEILTALGVPISEHPILGAAFFFLNVLGATFLTEVLYCLTYVTLRLNETLTLTLTLTLRMEVVYGVASQYLALLVLMLLMAILHLGLSFILFTGTINSTLPLTSTHSHDITSMSLIAQPWQDWNLNFQSYGSEH